MYARIEAWTLLDHMQVRVIGWNEEQARGMGDPSVLASATINTPPWATSLEDWLCHAIDEAHNLVHLVKREA